MISGCLRTLSSALLLPMHLKAGLCTGTPLRAGLLPVAAEVAAPEGNPAGLGARPRTWLWPLRAVAVARASCGSSTQPPLPLLMPGDGCCTQGMVNESLVGSLQCGGLPEEPGELENVLCLEQLWVGRLSRAQQLMLWMLWIALLRMTDPLGGIIPGLSPQESYSCFLGDQEPWLDPLLWCQGLLESLGAQLHEKPGKAQCREKGGCALC